MAAFASPAAATPTTTVMFDFNNNNATAPYNLNCVCSTTGTDPVGASNLTIANYMTQVLLNAGFINVNVTVTGAIGQMGAPPLSTANKTTTATGTVSYNGDGHVIEDPDHKLPVTLGDTEHYITGTTNQSSYPDPDGTAGPDSAGYDYSATSPKFGSTLDGSIPSTNQPIASDGYIKNCTSTDTNNAGGSTCSPKGSTGGTAGANSSSNQSNDMYITFGTKNASGTYNYLTGNDGYHYQANSISFDYQTFPDGSCTAPGLTSPPCGTSNLPNLTVYSGKFGSGGTQLVGGSFTAPNSSPGGISPAMTGGETAPQLLGVSGLLSAPINTTTSNTFDFVDWPATIGIDNFLINTKKMPEPGTLVLFGFGLLGLAGIARRRRASSVG